MTFLKKSSTKLYLTLIFLASTGFGQCHAERTSFLAFGDFGMGTAAQYQVAEAMVDFCESNPCDFITLLGDNFYPSGVQSVEDVGWEQKFENPYKKLQMVFYPALGNHDYGGNIEAQFEYSKKNPKWVFPQRYYSFVACSAEFFVLDTEKFDKAQALWLGERLAASTAVWKVVIGHRPIFSHGLHGDNEMLQKKLLPLIKNKIDFYLAGHDHDLEYIKKPYRPEFIISGAAAESRSVGKGKSTLFSKSTEGFAHLELGSSWATVKFLDKKGRLLFQHAKSVGRKN